MSKFEKYLALWVALCMLIGVILSQTVPGISEAIDSWQVRGISIPIGICLFLMMYPALLNLQVAELKKLRNNPTPIILTLFSNWVVAPLVAAGLTYLFLKGNEQLAVAVILLGIRQEKFRVRGLRHDPLAAQDGRPLVAPASENETVTAAQIPPISADRQVQVAGIPGITPLPPKVHPQCDVGLHGQISGESPFAP